jgi:protease PrsW
MFLADTKLILLALASGIVPTLIWLLFWLGEDKKKPEPSRLVVRAFLVGALAVPIAFYLEKIVGSYLGSARLASASSLDLIIFQVPLILVWALVEEGVKFGVAYIAIFRNKHFDEPIDAMIYMITVALGFAALENSLFLLSTLLQGEGIQYFLMTSNLRFLGATVLHLVSSAVLGAAIALSFCGTGVEKKMSWVSGLMLATLLHALFNLFIIITEGSDIFQVLMILWLGALLVIYLFERAKRIVCRPNFINVLLEQKSKFYAKR